MAALVYLDVESTGLDPYSDRIVEVALLRDGDDGEQVVRRVNPGRPIPKEATEVHGITDDDVSDAPSFTEIAEDVERIVAGAVLVTFAGRRFDVPMLDAELRRSGRLGLARDEDGFISQQEIDVRRLWMVAEPRTLERAAERFGTRHDSPHTAAGDASILRDVLDGMLADRILGLDELLYVGGDDDPAIVRRLIELTAPEDEVDRDGKFRRRESDGVIVFGFGKHKGKPVARNMDYVDWMLEQDFAPETVAWCRRFQRMAREAAERKARDEATLGGAVSGGARLQLGDDGA